MPGPFACFLQEIVLGNHDKKSPIIIQPKRVAPRRNAQHSQIQLKNNKNE
jgi:hypothetical protein